MFNRNHVLVLDQDLQNHVQDQGQVLQSHVPDQDLVHVEVDQVQEDLVQDLALDLVLVLNHDQDPVLVQQDQDRQNHDQEQDHEKVAHGVVLDLVHVDQDQEVDHDPEVEVAVDPNRKVDLGLGVDLAALHEIKSDVFLHLDLIRAPNHDLVQDLSLNPVLHHQPIVKKEMF